MDMPSDFVQPPHLRTPEGKERRVGVELEFTGLEFDAITAAVSEIYGGRVERKGAFARVVRDTKVGDFTVEIDATILQNGTYQKALNFFGIETEASDKTSRLESLIEQVSATVIPYEIVAPPIALSDLPSLEALRESLRKRGAEGTDAAIHFAFGLHINPEIPVDDPAALTPYLRAFLLLTEWLKWREDIDFTRKLTPFIRDFPDRYKRLVLDPDYRPRTPRFIDDYLDANPTRNRTLDMLPVLAWFDEKRVRNRIDPEQKLNIRPTFHYRLPNCRIDDPNWRIAHSWNGWSMVERMVEEPRILRMMSRLYLCRRTSGLIGSDNQWARETDAWLGELDQ